MNTSVQAFVILLVEDEAADAGLVKWAIKQNKLQVELFQAFDGHEALAFLRQQDPKHPHAPRPNLVLLDLNMPRMGGLEFLSLVQKDPTLADIRVVVLSTSNAENDIFTARDLGAVDYFSKPMDIHEFSQTFRVLADRWIAPPPVEPRSPKNLPNALALLETLPALPQIALEIMAIKLAGNQGNESLLKVINQDPAILAKTIGLANSPLFGSAKEIVTLKDAVTILGVNRIKLIALSFAMLSSLAKPGARILDVKNLWQHSMAVALALEELAKVMPLAQRPSEDELYLAGLLHDIGFLVLEYIDPKSSIRFHTARISAAGERLTSDLEAELLEMNHTELGAMLGKNWHLSERIIAVIRHHHDGIAKDAVGQPMITMANLVEKLLPTFDMAEQIQPEIEQKEWQELEIPNEKIASVSAKIRQRAQEAMQFSI